MLRRGRTKLSFCLASSASLARLAGVQFAIRNLDPMPSGPEPVEGLHAPTKSAFRNPKSEIEKCPMLYASTNPQSAFRNPKSKVALHLSRLSRFSIPFIVHRLPFTPYRLPFTAYRLPFTVHRSPLTVHPSPLTVHRSPLTVYRSPLTVYRSPFTIYDFNDLSDAMRSALCAMRYAITSWPDHGPNIPSCYVQSYTL